MTVAIVVESQYVLLMEFLVHSKRLVCYYVIKYVSQLLLLLNCYFCLFPETLHGCGVMRYARYTRCKTAQRSKRTKNTVKKKRFVFAIINFHFSIFFFRISKTEEVHTNGTCGEKRRVFPDALNTNDNDELRMTDVRRAF